MDANGSRFHLCWDAMTGLVARWTVHPCAKFGSRRRQDQVPES